MIEKLYTTFLKSTGVCTDTRKLQHGNLFFALKGPSFDGNLFVKSALENGALACVADDDKIEGNDKIFKVKNVLQTLQELSTYHRLQHKIPVIALTGSNGKTTTKELISAVLNKKYNTLFTQGNLNNHIGVPLTLLRLTEKHQMAVIEMGANHQREIAELCSIALPDMGMITNIGKAHLEGFGGIEGVIKGKTEMYDHLKSHKGLIFCRYENEILKSKCNGYENVIYYGTSPAKHIYGELTSTQPFLTFNWHKEGVLQNEIHTQLTGEYNLENLLAAVCIGTYFGVSAHQIKEAIEAYSPDNQRSQVMKKGSNTIILDAYNANPTSMEAALLNFDENYHGPKAIILGEMLELGENSAQEHQRIIDVIANMEKDLLILVGKNFLHTTLQETALRFSGSDDAKDYLSKHPLKNTTILIKGSRGSKMEKVLDALENNS